MLSPADLQRAALGQPFLPLAALFGDEETAAIFSEEAVVETWLVVERTLAEVQAEIGMIPADAAAAIAAAAVPANVELARLREKTRVVGYPILPLLEQIAEAAASADVGRYLHWGVTTQDVMDTALALQAARGLGRVEKLLVKLGDCLAERAREHGTTILAGRTHAQHAVPTTFGTKVAVWLAETARHVERVRSVRPRVVTVQLFGAGGTAAALGPASRELRHVLAARLGLNVTDVPWHAARDSVAELGFVLAVSAATCGKIGREVIELSRPEIGEVREAAVHQRGASSTMPQKVNPIESEVVVAMSVLASQQVPALLMAMAAPHERSAGEWQIEWDALPTVFVLSCGALAGAVRIVKGLEVFPKRMRANLTQDGGMALAEAVMMAAAPHLGRARAHEVIYEVCRQVRERNIRFREALAEALDGELMKSLPSLEELLEPERYLGEAESIVAAAIETWSRVRHPEP